MREAVEVVTIGEDRVGDGLALSRRVHAGAASGRLHAHDFHSVSLLLSDPGECRWEVGGDRAEVGRWRAGDLFVCPAFVPIRGTWERPFEAATIRLSARRLAAIARRAGFAGPVTLRPKFAPRDPFLREVAGKLAATADATGPGRDLLLASLATTLGVHLLRDYRGEPAAPIPPGPSLPAAEVGRVRRFMAANLAADLSVARLAAQVGRNPADFARRYRASTGRTPHQDVIRARVEGARALILGGAAIAEAAASVGFSGQSHLHGHARRLLGATPGAWAAEARGLRACERTGRFVIFLFSPSTPVT